jgi:hypothetical protein
VRVAKPNLDPDLDNLGAGIEEPAPDAKAEAFKVATKARLTAFDHHRDDLLGLLQEVCERKPKTNLFDPDESWRHLRFIAWCFLQGERRREQNMEAPAPDRFKRLLQLGTALGDARRKLDEAMHHAVRGGLYIEWCVAHGDPDFLDPIIDVFEREFDRVTSDVVAGMAALETAAFCAADNVRQNQVRRPGRPGGTSLVEHGFILSLERVYRESTGKRAGAGAGPFAQLVKKFLEALGRKGIEQQSIIKAIKTAKKREEENLATSRWGRSRSSGLREAFLRYRGQIPPASQ